MLQTRKFQVTATFECDQELTSDDEIDIAQNIDFAINNWIESGPGIAPEGEGYTKMLAVTVMEDE